jgi:hypothetical protein
MKPGPKHNPETIWKLVNARCEQLRQAVAWAWAPIGFTLAFATYWLSIIYIFEFGYPKTHLYVNSSLTKEISAEIEFLKNDICIQTKKESNTSDLDCENEEQILIAAKQLLAKPKAQAEAVSQMCLNNKEDTENIQRQLVALKRCKDKFNDQREKMEVYVDNRQRDITPPFGLPRIQITDLSPIGNLTTTILIAWTFFAARRENHALLSFVDFDQHTRRNGTLFPSTVTLYGQDKYISAEHLCYAYQAISQRFLIIVSSHSNPSRLAIIALTSFAPLTASVNLLIDFRDAISFPSTAFRSFSFHLFFNSTLVILIWIITLQTLKKQIETGTLLNAWYIAVRDVWMDEWDESSEEKASPVRIDIGDQRGERLHR